MLFLLLRDLSRGEAERLFEYKGWRTEVLVIRMLIMYYYMEHMKGYDLKTFFFLLWRGVYRVFSSCLSYFLYAVNMANTVCYVT